MTNHELDMEVVTWRRAIFNYEQRRAQALQEVASEAKIKVDKMKNRIA